MPSLVNSTGTKVQCEIISITSLDAACHIQRLQVAMLKQKAQTLQVKQCTQNIVYSHAHCEQATPLAIGRLLKHVIAKILVLSNYGSFAGLRCRQSQTVTYDQLCTISAVVRDVSG